MRISALSFLLATCLSGEVLASKTKVTYVDGVEVGQTCDCPVITMDFNMFSRGQYVKNELWNSHGIKFRAKNGGYTDKGPRVFDTAFPNGYNNECPGNEGDPDLGSPNEDCPGGGPGEGVGGSPWLNNNPSHGPNPYANCDPVGNVLIVQESNKACPDDDADGGTIRFLFKEPAEIQSVTILDIDEGNTPDIKVYDESDTLLSHIDVVATKNNGIVTTPVNVVDVDRVDVKFYGSGSVAEIKYKICI